MLTVLILVSLMIFTKGDWVEVMENLEDLLKTEANMTEILEKYIFEEEARLMQLKLKVDSFKKEHISANGNVSNYLSHPTNAYLLVKRLIIDWKKTENLMNLTQDVVKNMTNIKQLMKFPTNEDFKEAADALISLQDMYALDTASIAKGEINGIKYRTQLSSSDCFELGRLSYNKNDFYHTILWMREALTRHEIENHTETTKSDILEYLAYSTYKEGNLESALEITNELLDIIPDHPRALKNQIYYKNAIEEEENEKKKIDEKKKDEHFYKMGCRGNISHFLSTTSKLKCSYLRNTPFLKLAPLKEEEAYLKPRIILFRDSIYDAEIEIIKKMAHPKLRRAGVVSNTGKAKLTSYRISKTAWLDDSDHEVIKRLSKRVEDMTGLTTSTADELQVAMYGIGGYYRPHKDFIDEHLIDTVFHGEGTGNRIATVLFYMNTVAQGGGTVFTRLKLSLSPDKGTAAFWYNLDNSGEGDYDTMHGACPVLVGSKWISTKWLHIRGQEFLRPCSSQPGV